METASDIVWAGKMDMRVNATSEEKQMCDKKATLTLIFMGSALKWDSPQFVNFVVSHC